MSGEDTQAAPPQGSAAVPAGEAPRLVLVASRFVSDPLTGAGQRTRLLYDALAALGPTTVVSFPETPLDELKTWFPGAAAYYNPVGRIFALPSARRGKLLNSIRRIFWVRRRPETEALPRTLERIIGESGPAICVCRYTAAFRSARLGDLRNADLRVCIDIDDFDEHRVETEAAARFGRAASVIAAPLIWLIRRARRKVIAAAACVAVLSQGDAEKAGAADKAVVVPNTVGETPAADRTGRPSDGATILFVGTSRYQPNVDAIVWFVETCWPALSASLPDLRLRIVGRGGWADLRDRFRDVPGIDWIEDAPSLDDHYRAARLAISPVFIGAGTKIKVLEAAAWGRPVVARSHSADGFDPAFREHLDITDDPSSFVARCRHYLDDPAAADRTGAALRSAHDALYARDAVRDRFSAALAALVPTSAPSRPWETPA